LVLPGAHAAERRRPVGPGRDRLRRRKAEVDDDRDALDAGFPGVPRFIRVQILEGVDGDGAGRDRPVFQRLAVQPAAIILGGAIF